MAEYQFFLRPSADISVEHELVPEDSPNAYSLINEEVYDSSTYLTLKGVVGETVTATSSFKMSGVRPSDARDIFHASVNGLPGNTQVVATINGQQFVLNDSLSLFNYKYSSDDFIEAMKNYDESTEVTLTFTNTNTTASDEKITIDTFVCQVYIEVMYSNGVFRKVNNEWKATNTVYQKINGVWEQIENGYYVVGSKLHRMGHYQEHLPSAKPSCTETGLTSGYKCAICGEVFIPQTIIPANGHSYITSGGKNVCEVCQYVEGLGFTELVYHGTATDLSNARSSLAATTVGNYALFGGGSSYSSTSVYHSTVDAYDTSLTRTTATNLSQKREGLAATTVGNYALFGGGYSYSSTSVYHSTVDAYDTSLTRTTATDLSQGRYGLEATTVGNYALFGGGYSSSTVDAYDTSLTRTTATDLSQGRYGLAVTTVGNYALFGGGSSSSTVDAYDTSLTRTTATDLSQYGHNLAATTVGNYALFGGGIGSSTVDVYNASLTKTTATDLSQKREGLAATTVGNYALFGGGMHSSGSDKNYYSTVDVYNASLTKTTATNLSQTRYILAATMVGNYALFGGGGYSGGYRSTVDAYKLQPISQ